MKQFMKFFSLAAVLISFGLLSCDKDDAPLSEVQKALVAHIWRVETVTDYISGVGTVMYQRGAANNSDDYSLVRQTFKTNGTIQWVDEFGESGNNGSYELLANDTKIRLGLASAGLSVTGENLKVTATEFAYTLKHSATDSTRFVFSPL